MKGEDSSRSRLSIVTTTARRILTHPANRGRRLRRLAGWVGWQAWARTVRRPRTISFHDGLRMICHPHDPVPALVLYYGLYDVEEMRFLLAWLRPGGTFVDIGANAAPYSLLSTLVPDVRTVAFEPGSVAQQRARANIDLNGVGDRVELVPCAVIDDHGPRLLSSDRRARNSLVGQDYAGETEVVDAVSLDGFDAASPLGDVQLVKVDVEGNELQVLRGASSVLRRHRPALIVEVNDLADLQRFATAEKYEPVRFLPDTRSLVPRGWPTDVGGNILLVPDLDAARQRLAHTPEAPPSPTATSTTSTTSTG